MSAFPSSSGFSSSHAPIDVNLPTQGTSILPRFDSPALPTSLSQDIHSNFASLTAERFQLATRQHHLTLFRQSLLTVQPNDWAMRADRDANDQIRTLADRLKSINLQLISAGPHTTLASLSTTYALSACPRVKLGFGCRHAYLSPASPGCPGTATFPSHAECAPVQARFEQRCANCQINEAHKNLIDDKYAFGIAYQLSDSPEDLQTLNDVIAEHEATIVAARRDQPDVAGWESSWE